MAAAPIDRGGARYLNLCGHRAAPTMQRQRRALQHRKRIPTLTIADGAVLISGANRGIGQALVEEALSRGAKRVYAGTRGPLTHPDPRVTPVTLDVTSPAQIQASVDRVESLDVLINNAGIALYDDLSDRAVLERHLAVNLFGTYGVTQAFLPLLIRSRGAIVNNVSVHGLGPFAGHSGLRDLQGGRVLPHAVAPCASRRTRRAGSRRPDGPTDTDMTRGFDIPKASPSVARAILDGVANGEEEIFPDPCRSPWPTAGVTEARKALERQYAVLLEAVGAGSRFECAPARLARRMADGPERASRGREGDHSPAGRAQRTTPRTAHGEAR